MKLKAVNWTALLVGLLLIVAPSNLFLVLCEGCGYVHGLQSDYLIPRLYASDLIVLSLLVINSKLLLQLNQHFLQKLKTFNKTTLLITGFVIALAIRQLFTPYPLAATWNLAQIGVLLLVGWVVIAQKIIIPRQVWIYGLTTGLLLQAMLGWYQFLQQKPLLAYHFLGETNITRAIGIPTDTFGLKLGERILPHGTTAHPNILAGFIGVYSVLSIYFLVSKKLPLKQQLVISIAVPLSWSILLLTQSFSGAALLVGGGVALLLKNHLQQRRPQILLFLVLLGFLAGPATLLIPPTNNPSIVRRQYLLQTSQNYLTPQTLSESNQLLLGTGITNFTAVAEEFSTSKEIVRFNQPVHNDFWLFITENGVLGVALATVIGTLLKDKKPMNAITFALLLLLPVSIWDHYLFSLQPGRILVIILLTGLASPQVSEVE